MSTKIQVEEVREFATRDEAWAFMHECDATNGAVVAGYPSLTAPYMVRYFYNREAAKCRRCERNAANAVHGFCDLCLTSISPEGQVVS